MADSDILVTTRYTTEGYDQALSKADRIGQTMLKLSRDIGGIGRFLNDDFLIGVSNALGGIEDMIGAVSELSKVIRNLPPIGAAGLIFGGASLAANAVGKAYNTATGTVDTSTFVAAAQRLEDALKKIPADQAATAMETFNAKMQNASSAQRVAGMNALADSIDAIGKTVEKNLPMLSDFYQKTDKLLPRIIEFNKPKQYGSLQERMDAEAKILSPAELGMKALADASREGSKASQEYADWIKKENQEKFESFDRKYRADLKINELEIEIDNRRIAAAQSLASDLAKMDSGYYSQRLQLAQSFGLESQRAEEDHQRNMRRLQESHDKRLRKLAESRDALGIEDEVDSFEEERKNAEEDYQTQQARRNQDFAQQLRDMETAFQQQRQERINAYNQQLIDIANYNTAQRNLIAQQMRDIADAVMTAFTNAAKNFTAAQNTTNNTSQNVTQNNTINGVNDPMAVSQMINSQVKRIFDTAARR